MLFINPLRLLTRDRSLKRLMPGLSRGAPPCEPESLPPATSSLSPARRIAFDILRKVETGGYASDLLLDQTTGLESRDAGLASEIVFGVLRYRAQLDYLIEHYSGRRQKLDPEVRIALRMGIYQIGRA